MNKLFVAALKEETVGLDYFYHIGVGKINATYNLTKLINKYKPSEVINYGTAGAIKKIKDWGGKWGIYPNLGRTMPTKDGHIKDLVSNASFSKLMLYVKDRGASAIGGCCGSTPETIRKMTKYIKGK